MAFNVLIVDDSTSMRAIIKKVIKVSGFDIGQYFEAGDGRQALKVLEKEWIDLVMTDINMPNMDGIELITEMKIDELLGSIPVVMVTTEGSEERVQETMSLGARGYIKKPFHPEEVKKTLCQIMGETDDGERDIAEEHEDGDF